MKRRVRTKKKAYLKLLKSSILLLIVLVTLGVSSCSSPTVDDMVEEYNRIFDPERQ